MKSINTKIAVIIFGGMLLQFLVIGSLYRLLITRQVLSSVNNHETARQEILQTAVLSLEKGDISLGKAEELLSKYSKKHGVEYQIKDMDGNIMVTSAGYRKSNREIEELGFIRLNKRPVYILSMTFPLKLRNISSIAQGRNTRIFTMVVIFGASFFISFLIYEVLAAPLKKLKRAMEKMDYGKTEVSIPYYGRDELGGLCRNFEAMGKRLRKSEENQTELLQAISHDLKTPLTSIMGYIQRLIEGRALTSEKRDEYYSIIHRKAKDVKSLLDELDEYSSVNVSGRYEKEDVDFRVYFHEVCAEVKEEVSQRGSELEFVYSASDKIRVNIDTLKIRRVFGNIVENSLKYGGDKIHISCREDENNILMEFSDNGPGVPEGQLDNIFDRFYRLDTSRSREKGGTGLGLAICRGIVEAHGGKIGARNRLEGGLCIWVRLPRPV